MKLSELVGQVKGLEWVNGSSETDIVGLADDSRHAAAGKLFFALSPGETAGRHASEALARGAAAVVVPPGAAFEGSGPILTARDCRAALADAAAAFFAPTPRFPIVGITGTNGKTTTTLMTAAVLRQSGRKVAVIGTLGTLRDDGCREPSPNTTPGLLPLYATFRALEEEGYGAVAMEVSSQGIVQHRIRGIPFSAAVWTNLSPEHFELHGDLETYRQAKLALFRDCEHRPAGPAAPEFFNVLNGSDDSFGHFSAAARGRTFTFGLHSSADVRAEDVRTDFRASRFTLAHGSQRCPVTLALGGDFNVQNALAAAAVGIGFGLDLAAIARGLESVREVPGRFQAIGGDDRRVLVDYAHTSEGMEKLLHSCRALVGPGERLIVVFGCGGDRDRTKRPRMGSVAAALADLCIVTNDNPRTESPQQILADILTGIPQEHRPRLTIELDRERAIRLALSMARPADLVVIAGKGHEDYQILGTQRIHFDDREVVAAALEELRRTP